MMGKKRFGRASRYNTRRLRWKRKNPWSASFDRIHCSQLRVKLRRLNQLLDPGFDSQEPEKLSSDVTTTTSISIPDQSPPSPSRCPFTPDSVKFDTQEELSSHVTTTSMPYQAVSSSD